MKPKTMIATAAVTVTATGAMLVAALPVGAQTFEDEFTVTDRAAEILNVSSDELTDAFKQAQIEQIEDKIANDEIDAERGIALIQRIEESENLRFFGGPRREARQNFVQGYRTDVLAFLQIEDEEFRAYMQDGETLLDIAEDKNISEDALRSFLTDLHTESINSNENLTDEQKQERLERVDDIVDRIINFSPPAQRGEFNERPLAI